LTSYFPSSSAAAPGALVALVLLFCVLLFCVLLLFEQRRLLAELDKRDNRLDKIMHDHGGSDGGNAREPHKMRVHRDAR
jgi:hypothetical protein